MDLVTQGILGAAIGQTGFQKQLGRKALLWGCVAGLIPDLDVVIRSTSDPLLHLIHHRGFTHSIFFSLFAAPFFGYLLWRFQTKRDPTNHTKLFSWIQLMLWGLLTHPLLDVFTVYGTQLLWPITDFRFSFNSVSVIDPFYTGTLLASILIGTALKNHPRFSQWIGCVALFITSGYLLFGITVNQKAIEFAKAQLQAEKVQPTSVDGYTTMLQMPLRRIVAHVDNEIWVGYVSMNNPTPISWDKHSQPPLTLYQPLLETRDGKVFTWFCDNQFSVFATQKNSSDYELTLLDSRFGYQTVNTFGFWGIKAQVKKDGTVLSKVDWVTERIRISIPDIVNLWQFAFSKK